MSIIVKDLVHIYNPKSPFESKALDGVSLEIEKGEFIGLIGHTGSGKSTLIQHLNGLLKPSSGSIEVNGLDITAPGVNLTNVRKKVGLVFQYPEYQLFEETVQKDIAFGPANLGMSEEEIGERVKEAMEIVGLDYEALKDRSPFELSGGQRRRVAIAGVIAMKPEVLILDEPTAGLDPRGRDEIFSQIKALHKKIRDDYNSGISQHGGYGQACRPDNSNEQGECGNSRNPKRSVQVRKQAQGNRSGSPFRARACQQAERKRL